MLLLLDLALALDLLLLGGLLLAGGLALKLLLILLLLLDLALALDLLLLGGLGLRSSLTFELFIPTVIDCPGPRFLRGFGRAIQRSQLTGRSRGCSGLAATAAGFRCSRVHHVTLFTDHTHLLCCVVVATWHGFDGAGLRRPSGILQQLLFARGKRKLAGRWRIAYENPTVKCLTRWARSGGLARADHAAHARCNRGDAGDLTGRDRFAVEADRRWSHWLRIHEHAAGDRCDGARNLAVGIVHLIDIDRAAGIIVINVGDDCVVDYRIVHVDPREIVATGLIGRHIDFARSKREPADRRTPAERDRHAPAAATDEGDHRGCVDGANIARSRNPAPAIGYVDPASIVRGGEAPGCVVHPGPAPRFLPNPMTVPVGRPIGVDPAGEPHGAVAAHRAPATILIQIGVAHHIVVDVAQRCRAV